MALSVSTTQLRKGTIVYLRSGMRAKLEDNQTRQKTRIALVYGAEVGLFTEMGSIYASDIVTAVIDGVRTPVQATPSQLTTAQFLRSLDMGF